MKKSVLFLMLLSVSFIACEKEKKIDKDVIVFESSTFISEPIIYDEVKDIFGSTITNTITEHKVIRFKGGGKLEYFTVDEFDKITSKIVLNGSYKLNYPNISELNAGTEQSKTVVNKSGSDMSFELDGLLYENTLTHFSK